MSLKILDLFTSSAQAPGSHDESDGTFRGGGRFLQILHENLTTDEAEFIPSLTSVTQNDTLLIPIWDPFQAPLITQRVARKQILTIFDVIPLKYPQHFPIGLHGNIQLWKNKRALKNFDSFITISEHSKKDIIHYLNIPAEKIHVVYPTHARTYSTNEDVGQDQPREVVVYVGDINWNKNIATLAKALNIAQLRGIFVGKAFKKQQDNMKHPWLREFVRFNAENPSSRNSFPGYVDDEELKKMYQNALCNVLVSRDEGFGMSYLEAATQKCPSILADVPIFHEIALSAARFVPVDDPDAVAQAILELKQSPNMRAKIGAEAFERSKAFTPTTFRRQLLDVINFQ